ncbi:hypothetical protein B0H13DRAFT_2240976 [Mycena leptocephala]|nr:hypothetical protein B0H13DRAFT_2240976 [Mycena leptocephala]
MFSGGSSSSDDSSNNSSFQNSDDDEDKDVYYESLSINPDGPASYKASMMTLYRPVKKWKERYRYNWLNEVLRAEGRGDHVAHAKCVCRHPDCKSGMAEARCKDCHGCELLAKECMVREHERNPLHRVEDEAYFEQLLRIKWLPSTGKRPRTAATFNVLRRYHLLSLESKCSMGEFYQSLARQTNNTGEPPMTRYQEFINMTRQWRNIQMLKRAGRGHETDGIATTKEGPCPHPGKNLPPEWKDVPSEKKFLYALFLALDANFRMQRKDVSSEASDPDLGNGLAFFGEINSYMAHLEKHWDQPQPKSTCVAHDAVNTPDKEARGTASSGIGTVDARAQYEAAERSRDLQLGERYLNMDWMFFMSLADSDLQEFFEERIALLRLPRPQFHLPAHIESCNVKFSFLLTRYVGQTDGEAPERGWSNINPLAMSTREMGPNLRREVLDDHFNDWNWKKILNMGKYFYEKISYYVPEMVKTRLETLEAERTLPRETLVQWKAECVAWEADATQPNPFERKTKEISIASVRYELAEKGGGIMLAMGVQLEEQHKARRKILSWMETQTQFMPEDSRTKPVAGELVQDIPLLLPSRLPRDVACLRELQDFEFRLRKGQAHEALHELRHQLLVRTHAYKYKDKNMLGVRDTMRSLTKIEGIDDKINRASATYRVAHTALETLGERLDQPGWDVVLQVLKQEDVRQMPEGTFRKPGKRRKETASAKKRRRKEERTPLSPPALRIEWAKTRSFGLRNTEEVDLEEEEMRRTPEYLQWRANWWESKKIHTEAHRPDLLEDPRQREGHDAYATRQARMLRSIATRFERKWDGVAGLIAEGRAKTCLDLSQRASPNTRPRLLIVDDDEQQ